MTFPTRDFLSRMADLLVRDVADDHRDAERVEWIRMLQPDPDPEWTPDADRVWLESILRNQLVDAAIDFVDNIEAPPGATYDEWKAIANEHVRPYEELIAELRGIDLATLRRLEGWDT